MAKRVVTKIGDVFCVDFRNGKKGYFQYVAKDMTQLNSSVIRAFYTHYPVDQEVSIEEIVSDKVAFYAHTILRGGIDIGLWSKVGNSKNIDLQNVNKVTFAQGDMISHYTNFTPFQIWHINQPMIYTIGFLCGSKKRIEEGSVLTLYLIVLRMYTGYYLHTDPIFDILKKRPRPEYKSYVEYVDEGSKYFLSYKGESLEVCMIVEDQQVKRYTKEEAEAANLLIAKKKFSDTNWGYINFLTPAEFKDMWDNAENYLQSGDPEKIKIIKEISMKPADDDDRDLEFLRQ